MIILKNRNELDAIYRANQIVAETLQILSEKITSDIPTEDIDRIAEEFIRKKGGFPAFKGYRGFPSSICISINEEIVHGIPGKRRIKTGDIVSIDIGCFINGFYGDSAITVGVGRISEKAEKLIATTRHSLDLGIEKAQTGNRLSDISKAIQNCVESNGFSVVRDFVGHGIGKSLHEDPQIPNFYSPGNFNPRLKQGMVFALEPMVNEGTYDTAVLKDGWTAVTRDRKLSAHFEHSIAVTTNGPWILSSLNSKKRNI